MPVYNDVNFIDEAIDSVINQTLKDIELICIDDGSTDGSLDKLNDYANKYNFIKVFSQSNQGSGIARNNALKHAKGEYIAFLDSDDKFLDSNSLEKMYTVAKENNMKMVSANLKVLELDGKLVINKNLERFVEEKIISPKEYGIPYSFYKNIFLKSFLLDNNFFFPNLLRGQDPVFMANVLVALDSIYVVPIDFYALRSSGNNFGKINSYKKKYDYLLHFKETFEILKHAKFNYIYEEYKKQLFYYLGSSENSEKDRKEIKSIVNELFKDNTSLLNKCNSLLNNIKVSLIIPVYNAEEFLNESIGSVLNQTLKDIELVCVNDGSKDNSLKILQSFAKKDSRVKIINQQNKGCGAARNKALNYANGEYIYFFDPDDYIAPNALEELYKNAILNDSDFVIFKIASFIDGQPINYDEPGFEFEKIFGDIDFNNFTFNYKDVKRHVLLSSFAPWTKFYKKSFLDKYDDFRFHTNVAFDDVPFHVQSMLRASRISYVPEFFYYYRLSNPNSVNNTASNAPDIIKIIDYVENFLKDNGYYNEFREDFLIFKITQLSMYISSSNSEGYFSKVKKIVSSLNFSETDAFISTTKRINALKKYDAVINASSIDEYEDYLNNTNDYFTEIKKLESELNDLNVFANNLESNISSLYDSDELIDDKHLLNRIKTIAGDKTIKQDINELEGNSDLQLKNSEYLSQIDKLKKDNSDLQLKNSEYRTRIRLLKSDIKFLNKELHNLKKNNKNIFKNLF